MNYFLCAVTKKLQENYCLGIEAGVWGVIEQFGGRLTPVRPGDQIFFLVDGVLSGLCEVQSNVFKDTSKVWPPHEGKSYFGSVYPYRVRISMPVLESAVRLKDHVDELQFTKHARSWGGVVQGANGVFKRIQRVDAERMKSLMAAHAELVKAINDLLLD